MKTTTLLALLFVGVSLLAQDSNQGPANEKAQKTYREASEYLRQHRMGLALDSFRKADRQDGGHCLACKQKIITCAIEVGEWKPAETAASEILAVARSEKELAMAHYGLGIVLFREAMSKRKDEALVRAHDELTQALAAVANFPDAIYADGMVLAHLKRDDDANAQFERFVKLKPADDPDRQRALRYISQPELARARMTAPFAVVTMDGQRISLDDLKGKVVLLDFWATWCAPCRAAMPHIRKIAERFQGQPLTILSVSLDHDEKIWKEFVAKNGMNWPQYWDGGFGGPISSLFGVHAIPQTFTIDADGVLQDQHLGDEAIEGNLKKLVERAKQLQAAAKPAR